LNSHPFISSSTIDSGGGGVELFESDAAIARRLDYYQ
jgi:hypothetical protein